MLTLMAHLKIIVVAVLCLAVIYQWLRADSAVGYSDGLLAKLKIAQHDLLKAEQHIALLEEENQRLRTYIYTAQELFPD